jgi:hypothetical protein
MGDDTAGHPMSSLKWSRKSTYAIRKELEAHAISVCANTVARLLYELDFSLKCNRKSIAETQHPDRDQQFKYIAEMKNDFESRGHPVISVDSKKKELVGNFYNHGRIWCRDAELVNVHDFRSAATAIATPYGIYDYHHNDGMTVVGISYDTPEFAVDSIIWWLKYGSIKHYSNIRELLILCDAGGSNGYRPRAWKYFLQKKLCDAFQISATVCHYPIGASKWNPIEHRMFSHISNNWTGKPLRTLEAMLNYIRRTRTDPALKIGARLNKKKYAVGIKIDDDQMSDINIKRHEVLPQWNYTIFPIGHSWN